MNRLARICLGVGCLLMVTVLSRIPHAEEAVHPEGRDPRRIESDKRKADEKKRDEKRDGTEASYKKAFEGKDLTNAPRSETPSPEQLLKESLARKDSKDSLRQAENPSRANALNENHNKVTISKKISEQIKPRGWTEGEIKEITSGKPNGESIDNRNGKSERATVYGEPGKYVVVNDIDRSVVQISDKLNEWKDDPRIKWHGN